MEKINTNKFMLNCKQATFLYSKSLDTKITFYERLKLFMHFLMCKNCRQFAKQIKNIEENLNKEINYFDKKNKTQLTDIQKHEINNKINSQKN